MTDLSPPAASTEPFTENRRRPGGGWDFLYSMRETLRRIKARGSARWDVWILIAWVLFLLLVVIPWMTSQATR